MWFLFPILACIGGKFSAADDFIGIALDGNPIYGPNASDFADLITSADLDACHGRFKDGRYRYHITSDFPYTIGCFKGMFLSLVVNNNNTTLKIPTTSLNEKT